MTSNRTDRILIGCLVLAVCGFLYTMRDAFEERVIDEGDRAPNFSIRADDGRTITPTEFGGRVLVLNFWASWCQPCVQETPSLDAFAQEMKKDGVVVLAVSVDKSEDAYRKFLQKLRPSFLTARDPAADISSDYGTFMYPETYIIRDGKVVRKYNRPLDWTNPSVLSDVKQFL